MNRKKTILLAALIILGLVLTASATVYVLRMLNNESQVTPPANDNTDKKDGGDNNTTDKIDPEKNEAASKVEEEAKALMETDPQKAAKKYEEAASLYEEAGNHGKAADMRDSAMTAESMTPPEEVDFGEPVITR